MRIKRILLAAFAALFLFAAMATAQQGPTFQAATRLVEVDVVAKTRQGAPAAGLTKDDFTLLDNGKPRKIAFFSVRSRQTSARASIRPLPPGAFSNRIERDGDSLAHATVLLVDQKNTPQQMQAFAIQRIVKFVESRRQQDRIGVYTLRRNGAVQVEQELTDDGDLLRKAAKNLKPRDPNPRTGDNTGMTQHAAEGYVAIEVTERAMDSKHALQAIARHLAKLPGRKNLIWVTLAFPLVGPGGFPDFTHDMEEAARTLNDANVALYGVDARGLIGALSGLTGISNAEAAGPISPGRSGLPRPLPVPQGGPANPPGLAVEQMLAGLTGGLVFFNKSNAIEESIRTAVEDGDLIYTLGYYPAQEDQDGTFHDLKVAVARRNVIVRYRENYFASKTSGEANQRPTLDQLLKDSLNATQLELLAEPAPDPARPGFLRIKVNVDLHDIQLQHENARRSGQIDVSFFVEGTGKVLTKTLKIDVSDDQFAGFLEKGIDTVESIDTRGGVEAFRVVVQDHATGAAGSVTVPLPK